MKWFRRKELRDVWADERQMVRAYRAIWESSPILRRFYGDLWGLAMTEVRGGPVIEVGGGAGLIREVYPNVLSTDILPFPESGLRCDAAVLPFRDNSVGGIVGVAFFHHCNNPRRMFAEAARVLKAGGRLVIVDPYITPLSRIIYHFGTDEAVDLSEPPFESEDRATPRPLLEANVARGTIIFERHRKDFEREFPTLRLIRVDHYNLFRHLAAGSCVQKSPFPDWCYPAASVIDHALHPLRRLTGMLMRIVIEKETDRPPIGKG